MSIAEFIEYVKLAMEAELIANCPVDKGTLRLSIEAVQKGSRIDFMMLDYGVMLDQGTRPHKIEAKGKANGGADALTIPQAGGRIVKRKGKAKTGYTVAGKTTTAEAYLRKSVMHPGTRANPWIRNAFYHALPTVVEEGARLYLDGVDIEVAY